MNTTPNLHDQRSLLRAQLQLQRGLIHERLHPAPAPTAGFPRSRSMRLLTQHPQLALGIAAAAATLLVRPQLLKHASLLLGAARIARIALLAR